MKIKNLWFLCLFIINLNASNKIILMHGINGSSSELRVIEQYLISQGESVENLDYPSTEYPIEVLVSKYVGSKLEQFAQEVDTVHFACHSMGNIVLRYYLKDHPNYPYGRIVMMGPPNQGSQLTDTFKKWKYYKKRYGPAGDQIGTDVEDLLKLPRYLPRDTGIIAGSKSMFFVYSWILPGKDDGKVSHASMKSPGYVDFVTVPYHHDEMTYEEDVAVLILSFINNGEF